MSEPKKETTVIFYCGENMNKYQEEVTYEGDLTDDEIQEFYAEWVWEQIGERFSWGRKE